MTHPVVHFEVVGTDGPALEKFYGELFGWHTQSMPEMSYALVDTHAGRGINGGLGTSPEGERLVTFYVEAEDLQNVLDKAESLGAKTAMPVTEVVPAMVTIAMFTDPQGNRIGLVQGDGSGQEGGVSPGDGIPVAWFEILGTDAKALRTFYSDLFGWTFKLDEKNNYGEVDTRAGRGIPGAIGQSQGEPTVTVYADVDDLEKYLERAESLGGKTVLQPLVVGEGLRVAAFRDPQDNLFGLFTMK